MKKFGIVLPTYPYDHVRARLIEPAMRTLEKTKTNGQKPKLLMILRQAPFYVYDTAKLAEVFDLTVIPDPESVSGTEQTLAYGTQWLIDRGCDYITWMGDDALFHPQWHLRLQKLIQDKPLAKGWSVYRSAYETFHQTMTVEDEYVMVSTLCGHGMTFEAKEWVDWGIDWRGGEWMGGLTLDLQHAIVRGGEHWTTKVSYVEHTGRDGVHCRPYLPEWAVDFQGTEEQDNVHSGQ